MIAVILQAFSMAHLTEIFEPPSTGTVANLLQRYENKASNIMFSAHPNNEAGKLLNDDGYTRNADMNCLRRELEDSVPELHKPNFYPPYKPNGAVAGHSNISLEAYCRVLATFIDDTRGTNLQGFQASGTVTAIFRQQSVHWGTLSREYIDSCYLAASKFVKCAVMHVAGKYTGDKLMLAFVYQSLTEIETRLGKRLNDLLWPYQKSHPSTQHPSFSAHVNPPDRTQRSESTGESTHSSNGDVGIDADDSWASTALKLNFPNNLVYAADALDTADAYYDVSTSTNDKGLSLIMRSWRWIRSSITQPFWESKQSFLTVSRLYSPTMMSHSWQAIVWLRLLLNLLAPSRSAMH
jgi:hypothetical protein